MQGHRAWPESPSLDAQCLFSDFIRNVAGEPAFWMAFNLFLTIVSYSTHIIALYESSSRFADKWLLGQPRQFLKRQVQKEKSQCCQVLKDLSFGAVIKRMILLVRLGMVLLARIVHLTLIVLSESSIIDLSLDLFWFSFSLCNLVEDRDIPSPEMGGTENKITFGQIIPILLLSSTIFVIREAYEGKHSAIAMGLQRLKRNGSSIKPEATRNLTRGSLLDQFDR